jgi:uncharacterized heparinase superfamily protein
VGPGKVSEASQVERRQLLAPCHHCSEKRVSPAPFAFDFLNISRNFESAAIHWAPVDVPRLWRYNLHYFDCLRDQRPDSAKQALIDNWVEHNPQGSQPAWEPYTASLRIANWVKYFLHNPDAVTDTRSASLFTQARWLRKNLERHILANHYFENIKALTFAGAFFVGDEADGWLRFATSKLAVQLQEQTLADGCHYERTPAYHCLMLQNYLELYALMQANPGLFSEPLVKLLRDTANSGLVFLADILLPAGRIPLLNDSAFNSAPLPRAVFTYANSLGFDIAAAKKPRLVEKPDAGSYGYIADEDGFLIDCGDIGPSYQPGHTHCDFLSYELVLNGQPIVVDTGVYEYEPGEMRHYVRSTGAHNTVSVGGDEQSEIWGEFRVARRAKKLGASIVETQQTIDFTGAYRGFYALGGKVEHQRRVSIGRGSTGIDSVSIVDVVTGAGDKLLESFIHLHPDVEIDDDSAGNLTLVAAGSKLELTIGQGLDYRIQDSFYCPEFGLKLANRCIVLYVAADRGIDISYQIKKIM